MLHKTKNPGARGARGAFAFDCSGERINAEDSGAALTSQARRITVYTVDSFLLVETRP